MKIFTVLVDVSAQAHDAENVDYEVVSARGFCFAEGASDAREIICAELYDDGFEVAGIEQVGEYAVIYKGMNPPKEVLQAVDSLVSERVPIIVYYGT